MVLAFGVTRSKGQLAAEIVYVSPVVGVNKEHAPLPAGREVFEWHVDSDVEAELVTVDWPGLTTGVPAGSRVHYDIIFKVTEETE